MTWIELAERWHVHRVQAKSKWPKLSDADLSVIGGSRDRLIAMLEHRYGLPPVHGEQHVDEWLGYEAGRRARGPRTGRHEARSVVQTTK